MLVPEYPPAIAAILANLFSNTAAASVLLVNRAGVLCGGQGDCLNPDLQSLRAALSGDMFTRIAEHTSTPIRRPGMTVQHHPSYAVLLAEVLNQHVLALVFRHGTHLGLVKTCTSKAVIEMNKLL